MYALDGEAWLNRVGLAFVLFGAVLAGILGTVPLVAGLVLAAIALPMSARMYSELTRPKLAVCMSTR